MAEWCNAVEVSFTALHHLFFSDLPAQSKFDNWVNPEIDSSYVDIFYKDLIVRL
jgi:hypothetical protein